MRAVPLTVLKGGINRQRTKGGARADTLYDLVNGHITDAGTVVSRYGTRRMAAVSADTKGLVSFAGLLHVFSHESVEVPDGFVLHVLSHPESSEGDLIELERIHFAVPFMGFLYVAAEFVDGNVYYFWLQTGGTWEASTHYALTAVREPTVPNGFAYQAQRLGAPNPVWTPSTLRTEGDLIEPTEYNGFYYEATSTIGDTPSSGSTEPSWPTEEGATIEESELLATGDPDAALAEDPDPNTSVDPSIAARFDLNLRQQVEN